MACKKNYSDNPEIANLQRKFDQENELMSLALQDGDGKAASVHKEKIKQIKNELFLRYYGGHSTTTTPN